jgi:hypothetical protein
MAAILGGSAGEGLERSCGARDWVRARGPIEGVELLQASFSGRAYARHRHDTYATHRGLGERTRQRATAAETG